MASSPEGDRVVVLLNGWREQGLQIVDPANGRVTQDLPQPAAFIGLAFSPDGRWLYTSGGNQDVIYRYAWSNRQATLQDSIVLAVKRPNQSGTRYPAGLAISADGRALYVAENLADSLAVIDLQTRTVAQRLATERYPYGVVVGPGGDVYVSAWGGSTVSVLRPQGGATRLTSVARWPAGRHPSALLLNRDGSRLFVASGSTDLISVLDTRSGSVVKALSDAAPTGPREGSTPDALALSTDGTRLFVAEADNNAVALFDLSATTSGAAGAAGSDALAGRIPAGWYPSAVAERGDTLLVVNGKGRTAGPNPDLTQPGMRTSPTQSTAYTLGQLSGTMTVSVNARAQGAELARLSERVSAANGWGSPARTASYPPIRYVLYIIKENRSYDQVLGDLPQGDGDTSLVFFPRDVSPNHHALAERFGLYDRFFVNAEVSPDGHNWSMGAYATDYLEEDGAVELLGTWAELRLRGHQSRPRAGGRWSGRRLGAGERISVGSCPARRPDASQLRRVRDSRAHRLRHRGSGRISGREAVSGGEHQPRLPEFRPRHSRPASRRYLHCRVSAAGAAGRGAAAHDPPAA